ncbi:MAG: hypothetical protein EOO11_11215 [Chitinophagaceae bacterium]|nr:MAG: hypothetical protein EOO11_11215 [Chitinophagaceae bacterium]
MWGQHEQRGQQQQHVLLRRERGRLPGALAAAMVLLLLASLLVLAWTRSRSGWMGLSAALLLFFLHRLRRARARKLLVVALPAGLALLGGLIAFKPGSSAGRMLIYRVSARIWQDHWLWGTGSGQFKVLYNQYQAAYFSGRELNSPEALLSDNSYYAFNDLLQWVIEHGLAGLLLAAGVAGLALRALLRAGSRRSPVQQAAAASLLSLVVAGMFSYPFQVLPLALHAVLCLAVLAGGVATALPALPRPLRVLPRWAAAVPGLLLLLHFGECVRVYRESEEAYAWQQTGYLNRSLDAYAALQHSYVQESSLLYRYGEALFLANRLQEAAPVLEEAKRRYASQQLYKLSAQVQAAIGREAEAERDYRTAVFMVPNRMRSRHDLLAFYARRNDTAQVRYWSRSLLQMPVKVPSALTAHLQQQARNLLEGAGGADPGYLNRNR